MTYTREAQIERADARALAHRMTVQRNDAIRRLMRAGEPDDAIMRRFGVSRTTLNKLRPST